MGTGSDWKVLDGSLHQYAWRTWDTVGLLKAAKDQLPDRDYEALTKGHCHLKLVSEPYALSPKRRDVVNGSHWHVGGD